MADGTAEVAVRNYLTALRDPSSLRDEGTIAQLQQQLESSSDELERLQLRQQLFDMDSPSVQQFEDEFVTHARAWADEYGITAKAFEAEGVPNAVLRRAGFSVGRGGGRSSSSRRSPGGGGTRRRSRVTVDQVRSSIPRGTFTIKQLQDASGASPAVVRKVVQEELAAGRLTDEGTSKNHSGPGRAPTVYKRAKR